MQRLLTRLTTVTALLCLLMVGVTTFNQSSLTLLIPAYACEVAIYYQKPANCEKRTELERDGLDKNSVIEEIQHLAFKASANTIHVTNTEVTDITVHDIEAPVAKHYIIRATGYFCENP